MTIRILFFGVVSEQVGTSGETHSMTVENIAELKHELASRHPVLQEILAKGQVNIWVNGDAVNDGSQLHDGDEVAFLPPFAGG